MSIANDPPFLNVLDPDFRPDSAEVDAARKVCWYAKTPVGIAVLRYDMVAKLFADERLHEGMQVRLAAQGVTEGPLWEWMNSIILTAEGERHRRLYRLASEALAPRAVAALRPHMARIANELIDAFIERGHAEFIGEFADIYPARVICELLGVPRNLHDRVRGWVEDLGLAFSFSAAEELKRSESALAGLFAATDEMIALRRREPGPDAISALIAAESEGDRFDEHELRVMVSALLFAGQDTTRNQFGQAMIAFAQHPEQWEMLAQNPGLARTAVEEVLRVVPSTPTMPRIAVEDFEIDGLTVTSGTMLLMMTGVANTDPKVFGQMDFDITSSRQESPLTFGRGIHFCLGAPLARTQMAEALPILAQRLGRVEIDGEFAWRPRGGIEGPITLPIRFDGRSPSAAMTQARG
jgi:cytochrome P450